MFSNCQYVDAAPNDTAYRRSVHIRRGWLQKRGKWHTAWKRRWFILKTDGHLHYFQDIQNSKSGESRGSINLHGAKITKLGPGDEDATALGNTFAITTPTRIWKLRARDKIEANTWKQAIQRFTIPSDDEKTGSNQFSEDSAFSLKPFHSGVDNPVQGWTQVQRDSQNKPHRRGSSVVSNSSVSSQSSTEIEGEGSKQISLTDEFEEWEWSTKYSKALQMPEGPDKMKILQSAVDLFSKECERTVVALVLEAHLSENEKTIPTCYDNGGGEHYLVNGILYKYADDTQDIYGGDEKAMKVAAHEFHSRHQIFCAGVKGLNTPLTALIDHRGHRILASSWMDFSDRTLMYGSCDSGQTIHKKDSDLTTAIEECARIFNLQVHAVGTEGVEIAFGFDVEGHKSDKGVFYIIDAARIFPPEAPEKQNVGDILSRHLRPEFCKSNEESLCSDAFTKFNKVVNSEDYDRGVEEATDRLKHEVVPHFAELLNSRELIILDSRDLSYHMHKHGINMRFLGLLRSKCRLTAVRKFILTEMAIRSAKTVLRRQLRKTPPTMQKETTVQFLNQFLGDTTRDSSVNFWANEIFPIMSEKFENYLDEAEMSNLNHVYLSIPRYALLAGVCSVLGIEIAEAKNKRLFDSVALYEGNPFEVEDIVQFRPRIRTYVPLRNVFHELYDLSERFWREKQSMAAVGCLVVLNHILGKSGDRIKKAIVMAQLAYFEFICGWHEAAQKNVVEAKNIFYQFLGPYHLRTLQVKLMLSRIKLQISHADTSFSDEVKERNYGFCAKVLGEFVKGLEYSYPFASIIGDIHLFRSCALELAGHNDFEESFEKAMVVAEEIGFDALELTNEESKEIARNLAITGSMRMNSEQLVIDSDEDMDRAIQIMYGLIREGKLDSFNAEDHFTLLYLGLYCAKAKRVKADNAAASMAMVSIDGIEKPLGSELAAAFRDTFGLPSTTPAVSLSLLFFEAALRVRLTFATAGYLSTIIQTYFTAKLPNPALERFELLQSLRHNKKKRKLSYKVLQFKIYLHCGQKINAESVLREIISFSIKNGQHDVGLIEALHLCMKECTKCAAKDTELRCVVAIYELLSRDRLSECDEEVFVAAMSVVGLALQLADFKLARTFVGTMISMKCSRYQQDWTNPSQTLEQAAQLYVRCGEFDQALNMYDAIQDVSSIWICLRAASLAMYRGNLHFAHRWTTKAKELDSEFKEVDSPEELTRAKRLIEYIEEHSQAGSITLSTIFLCDFIQISLAHLEPKAFIPAIFEPVLKIASMSSSMSQNSELDKEYLQSQLSVCAKIVNASKTLKIENWKRLYEIIVQNGPATSFTLSRHPSGEKTFSAAVADPKLVIEHFVADLNDQKVEISQKSLKALLTPSMKYLDLIDGHLLVDSDRDAPWISKDRIPREVERILKRSRLCRLSTVISRVKVEQKKEKKQSGEWRRDMFQQNSMTEEENKQFSDQESFATQKRGSIMPLDSTESEFVKSILEENKGFYVTSGASTNSKAEQLVKRALKTASEQNFNVEVFRKLERDIPNQCEVFNENSPWFLTYLTMIVQTEPYQGDSLNEKMRQYAHLGISVCKNLEGKEDERLLFESSLVSTYCLSKDGAAYSEQQVVDAITRFFEFCETLPDSDKRNAEKSASLRTLCEYYAMRFEYRKALGSIVKAIGIYKKTSDPDLGILCTYYGLAAQYCNNVGLALKCACFNREALDIFLERLSTAPNAAAFRRQKEEQIKLFRCYKDILSAVHGLSDEQRRDTELSEIHKIESLELESVTTSFLNEEDIHIYDDTPAIIERVSVFTSEYPDANLLHEFVAFNAFWCNSTLETNKDADVVSVIRPTFKCLEVADTEDLRIEQACFYFAELMQTCLQYEESLSLYKLCMKITANSQTSDLCFTEMINIVQLRQLGIQGAVSIEEVLEQKEFLSESNTQTSAFHQNLGCVFSNLKSFDKAEHHLKCATKLCAKASTYAELAHFYMCHGDFETAKEHALMSYDFHKNNKSKELNLPAMRHCMEFLKDTLTYTQFEKDSVFKPLRDLLFVSDSVTIRCHILAISVSVFACLKLKRVKEAALYCGELKREIVEIEKEGTLCLQQLEAVVVEDCLDPKQCRDIQDSVYQLICFHSYILGLCYFVIGDSNNPKKWLERTLEWSKKIQSLDGKQKELKEQLQFSRE